MQIPTSIIVNADDIGLRSSVNNAILYSFEQGYINSTSLLTNMDCFAETVDFIRNNPAIINIGLHGNFAEGKPVTDFKFREFLDDAGNWNLQQTSKLARTLNKETRSAFAAELDTQLEKALLGKINITHIDSHLHLHTLPTFYNIYIDLAKRHNLKLRLAQTYPEKRNYIKFFYRKFLNNKIKANQLAHSDYFESVAKYLSSSDKPQPGKIEIMVHPDFDESAQLFDHVDGTSMEQWVEHIHNSRS